MKPDTHVSNVVNFLQFRAMRNRGRLPLFDDASSADVTRAAAVPVLVDRSLSGAGVEHRARMLKHLAETQRS